MATVASVTGPMQLTVHGKRMVAASMYAKGKSFLGAAILLRQNGGYEYVVLHLLCQGIEVALKGLLLFIDCDKFEPKLRRIGHSLLAASEATARASGLAPLKPLVRAELGVLSNLYSQHLLRYGSGYDILMNPSTVPSQRILHRMAALLRLVERKGLVCDATI